MKKLFLCVALIAFLATNASGGNQYQTDQLRTCTVGPPTHQIMPVFNFVANDVTPVTIASVLPANQKVYVYYSIGISDGWRAPFWVPSMMINSSIQQLKAIQNTNQNTPHIYALNRYRKNILSNHTFFNLLL